MKSILLIARQFYRAAQDESADAFEDVALAVLAGQVPFGSALWLRGGFARGQLQLHGLHGYHLPSAAVPELVSLSRQYPLPIAMSVASPGVALVFHAATLYREPAHRPALECVSRWGLERQMAIADIEEGAGEWLSLHRGEADAPFDQRDRTVLGLLMPHLFESRSVNRALALARTSSEPFSSPGPHRALTLLDGTVLHCGSQVSESIACGWPEWDGARLPRPLLQQLTGEGSAGVAQRGESICARRFSDSLVLTVKAMPLTERLTRREREVARYFGAGWEYKEIARQCGLAPATVRNILQRSYRKLGINNKAQLARLISRVEGDS